VFARFVALASVYRDWCSVAYDETQEDDIGYWIEDLELNQVSLGQLVPNEALSDDPHDAAIDALGILANRERQRGVDTLWSAHGGQVKVCSWR